MAEPGLFFDSESSNSSSGSSNASPEHVSSALYENNFKQNLTNNATAGEGSKPNSNSSNPYKTYTIDLKLAAYMGIVDSDSDDGTYTQHKLVSTAYNNDQYSLNLNAKDAKKTYGKKLLEATPNVLNSDADTSANSKPQIDVSINVERERDRSNESDSEASSDDNDTDCLLLQNRASSNAKTQAKKSGKRNKKSFNDETPQVLTDFEQMLEKRKNARKANRTANNNSFVYNDSRDIELINKMYAAAEEDIDLYHQNKPAVKKASLLGEVKTCLFGRPMQMTLLDNNILGALAAWITPLTKTCLPSYCVRSTVLKLLQQLPRVDKEYLKDSRIGQAVMYLSKHPLEYEENKKICQEIIDRWSRQVFNISDDIASMSKEDRLQRDKTLSTTKQVHTSNNISATGITNMSRNSLNNYETNKSAIGAQNDRENNTEELNAKKDHSSEVDHAYSLAPENLFHLGVHGMSPRPGESNFVTRARVPQPSNRTYIVRPKSTVKYISKQRKSRFQTQKEIITRKFTNYQKKMNSLPTRGSKDLKLFAGRK